MAARRYSLRVRRLRILMAIALAAPVAGCAGARRPPLTVLPTQQVTISRLISKDYPPKASNCTVATLAKMPLHGYHDLGTIHARGVARSEQELTELIDQAACSMGADAVFISQEQQQGGGPIQYQVTARALASAHMGPRKAADAEGAGAQEPQSRTVEVAPKPGTHPEHAHTIEVAPAGAATSVGAASAAAVPAAGTRTVVALPAATVIASPEPAATASPAVAGPAAMPTVSENPTPVATPTAMSMAMATPAIPDAAPAPTPEPTP